MTAAPESDPHVFTAYLPDIDIEACLWIHIDGSMELATRPGHERHDVAWSRGSELKRVGSR